jgi:hypothetical protein
MSVLEPSPEQRQANYIGWREYNKGSLLVVQYKKTTLNREIAARTKNRKMWIKAGRQRAVYHVQLQEHINKLRAGGLEQAACNWEKGLTDLTVDADGLDKLMQSEGLIKVRKPRNL